MMKVKFLHLSDLHFLRKYPVAETGYPAVLYKMTSPLVQVEECLNQIAISELDFVLISGDLTDGGDHEDYRYLRRFMETRLPGKPLIVTPGNHDNRLALYRGWLGERERTTPYNQVVELENLTIVSFDNSAPGCPAGQISEEQTDWLEETLAGIGSRPVILMTHHHFNSEQSDMAPVSYPDRFERIVAASTIIGIFGGHTHYHYEGSFAGKPYFTCGSLSFVGESRKNTVVFRECSSAGLAEINGGDIRYTRIPVREDNKILFCRTY